MELRNVALFEKVFPWKETQENCSLKRTIGASLSSHHLLEDDKVELIRSERGKKTKTFGPNFLTYLLENEP
jgi:F0F1-type ATP synthase delta subunit